MILGSDISVWQDDNYTPVKTDFKKMKAAGCEFCIMKASQGNWMDEDYPDNVINAKKEGLVTGAYHFLTWDVAPKSQAYFHAELINRYPSDLPPVVDYEWWKTVPPNALDILGSYIAEIQRLTGRTAINYTGPYFWLEHGSANIIWKKNPLWIANYGVIKPMIPPPWVNWTFWQYTSKGDGLKYGVESKQIDLNYFNGTLADLYRLAGKPYEETETPVDTTSKVIPGALNIRVSPNINSESIGMYQQGQELEILETLKVSDDETWLKVATWVAGRYAGKNLVSHIPQE